jgi:hypothetical protein
LTQLNTEEGEDLDEEEVTEKDDVTKENEDIVEETVSNNFMKHRVIVVAPQCRRR